MSGRGMTEEEPWNYVIVYRVNREFVPEGVSGSNLTTHFMDVGCLD